ncbi:hypothetical protein [Aneurinibacillus migulanus]|uniref:hypothetical protein n=1 Tax=Aneurinibacillus migulanus TaxID=47500 RepID=UPI00209DC134|nr:hypothetical protein [Aneurinibacillus migulanus]MCP1354616.1 hypothetical protein [Aneurinibacillus migulanus]
MTDKYEFEPFDFSEEKAESIANTTPINDIHAIQAERFEERRPITLEEMRDLNVFFGNRKAPYWGNFINFVRRAE